MSVMTATAGAVGLQTAPALRCCGCPRLWGMELRAFLYQSPAFDLLAPLACGWLDGGCGILAEALVLWLGDRAELKTLNGTLGVAHVLVRAGEWYLDGDGVSSPDELLERWREVERVEEPYVCEYDWVDACGVPEDHKVSETLAGMLAARFDSEEVLSRLGVLTTVWLEDGRPEEERI